MITFPLTFPAIGRIPASITIRQNRRQNSTRSPFTGAQTLQIGPGEWWEMHVSFPPLKRRQDAEDVLGWLSALNGQEGSFLMGPWVYRSGPRGTWAGQSPLMQGAGQTSKNLFVDGLVDGSTIKRGDWFQLGSGSTARLHKIMQDATVGGSPTGTAQIDVWPAPRGAPADNAPLTLVNPVGLWMLASPQNEWSIGQAQVYGIELDAVEDLRGL